MTRRDRAVDPLELEGIPIRPTPPGRLPHDHGDPLTSLLRELRPSRCGEVAATPGATFHWQKHGPAYLAEIESRVRQLPVVITEVEQRRRTRGVA